MNTCFDDNSLSEWHGCCADTPTPITHESATGSAVSTIIADTSILAQHLGLPVTGANIPANCFVGTVTPGVSFVLINQSGTEEKPTGSVTGVTLAGVGWMCRNTRGVIVGSNAFMSLVYGVDDASYGVVIRNGVTNVFMCGLRVEGSETTRFIAPLTGNLSASSWVGLLQTFCANFNSTQSQLASQHGATLKLTNSTSANFLEIGSLTGSTLAKIDTNANVTSTKGVAVFSHAAPSSQHAAIVSPAAELAALKMAVDALREVLKEYGLTA